MLFTGFYVAARQPWIQTVTRVMAETAARARGKSHQWMGVRSANDWSH